MSAHYVIRLFHILTKNITMATSIPSHMEFGIKLCEILKLNAHEVSSISIKIVPSDIVIFKITKIMTNEESKQILEELTKYELHKKDENETDC